MKPEIQKIQDIFHDIYNSLPKRNGYIFKPTSTGFDIFEIPQNRIEEYLVLETLKKKVENQANKPKGKL